MRNKATHSIQPITREDAKESVEAAMELVQALVGEGFFWQAPNGLVKVAEDLLGRGNWFQQKQVCPLSWQDAISSVTPSP